jgi:transposase InsO family protein
MSRKGNAYDNAVVESFFSNLKNELICPAPELPRLELFRS